MIQLSSAFWQTLLPRLAMDLPILIVAITGIVVAIAFRRYCRRASSLALLACILLSLGKVFFTISYTLMVVNAQKSGAGRTANDAMVLGVLSTALSTAVYALLLAAAFAGRKNSLPASVLEQ